MNPFAPHRAVAPAIQGRRRAEAAGASVKVVGVRERCIGEHAVGDGLAHRFEGQRRAVRRQGDACGEVSLEARGGLLAIGEDVAALLRALRAGAYETFDANVRRARISPRSADIIEHRADGVVIRGTPNGRLGLFYIAATPERCADAAQRQT